MYKPDLAAIHHAGFGDVARNAAETLLSALRDAGHSRGTVVDLGCGSGILSRIVSDAGYDVLGVDYSPDMVALSRTHASKARFVQASVIDVELPRCVGVAAIGEIFCYAFDPRAGLAQFARVARRIYDALEPGGIFLFDVAGPGRVVPSPRTNLVDHAEWTILHRATESGDTLTREILTFMRDGEVYRRSDETHVLRLYTPAAVLYALREIGFHAELLPGYTNFKLPAGWHGFLATR